LVWFLSWLDVTVADHNSSGGSMPKFDKNSYKQGLPGLVAVVIGLLYWPVEALIHYLFFEPTSFLEALLEPSPNEAWMRALVVVLFVFFGAFIYRLEIRQRDYISELEMLKEALEHAGEGVIITDGHGMIQYVNKAFQRTTGYGSDEAIGNNPSMLQSGKQDALFYRTMWQTMQQEGEWCGRIWNRRKNGEIYPEQLHICAMYGADGAIRHHVGVFFDITEQLRLEEQLRQSQKLEAIGTLVGGIAHDFNNILTSMTGNLFLVKMELEDSTLPNAADLQEKLDLIENEGFRAAAMIQHLLAFARKGVVQLQPFDLVASVQGIIDLARPSIHRSIAVERCIDDDVLQVFGDSHQLEEVVINLLNNAADALKDHESPRIDVTVTRSDYPNGLAGQHPLAACVKLSVADNGMGIEEEDLERIFEPFFTTKDVGQGTGLGLAMVYGAVQIHKGHIDVKSSRGKGTEVIIYLPLYQSPTQSTAIIEPSDSNEPNHKLLMFLEQEPQMRVILIRQLHSLGCDVLVVNDMDELCSCLTDKHVQGVILDASFVTTDDAITKIHHQRKAMTVMVMIDASKSITKVSSPLLHYLKKPVVIDDLKQALRQCPRNE